MTVLPLEASAEQVLDAVIAVESIYQLRDVEVGRVSNVASRFRLYRRL